MAYTYVGTNIPRPDAAAKATGRVQFLDDLRLPGLLHIAFLRPDCAHAKIVSIDTSEAER